MRFAVVFFLGLALAVGSAQAAVKVARKTITLKTRDYEIEIAYPQSGVPAVDDVVKRFVNERLAEYKTDDHDNSERAYAFELNFSVQRNDAQVFAVLFSEYSDTGGAHPNSFFYSLNFLMPDGAQVFLPEIIDGQRGLARISQYAIADLHKQMDGPDSMSDNDWLKRGAGPLATNFDIFVLKPAVIAIQFPAYQVAAYAAGPQEVSVPLSYMKGYMRQDWRAPQPSFDCRKAATGIERAICADAALARMDRQAAELYAEHMANGYEKTELETWRRTQRAWLAKRNSDCTDASVACLKKSYAGRLAALRKYSAQ
jgi:uncharacterized protein YecT (DUF1311 family)